MRPSHSPSRHPPTYHLSHELLSVPTQDPQGVLHASASCPALTPIRVGWERVAVVRALRGLLSLPHTRAQSGSTRYPSSNPQQLFSHSTQPGRAGEGQSRGQSSTPPFAAAPWDLQGPRGAQDPSCHHLPVLPRFQKRLPVSSGCPRTWGWGRRGCGDCSCDS